MVLHEDYAQRFAGLVKDRFGQVQRTMDALREEHRGAMELARATIEAMKAENETRAAEMRALARDLEGERERSVNAGELLKKLKSDLELQERTEAEETGVLRQTLEDTERWRDVFESERNKLKRELEELREEHAKQAAESRRERDAAGREREALRLEREALRQEMEGLRGTHATEIAEMRRLQTEAMEDAQDELRKLEQRHARELETLRRMHGEVSRRNKEVFGRVSARVGEALGANQQEQLLKLCQANELPRSWTGVLTCLRSALDALARKDEERTRALDDQSNRLHNEFAEFMQEQKKPLRAALEKAEGEARDWELRYHNETLLRHKERLDSVQGTAAPRDARPVSEEDLANIRIITDISETIAERAGLRGAKRPRTEDAA
jgi:DNA repair exonuclease SbcCD ATPase subunit